MKKLSKVKSKKLDRKCSVKMGNVKLQNLSKMLVGKFGI